MHEGSFPLGETCVAVLRKTELNFCVPIGLFVSLGATIYAPIYSPLHEPVFDFSTLNDVDYLSK